MSVFYSSDVFYFVQMCKLESLEMGDCWVKGDVEIYEFITKPDIGSYVPNQFKHFLPGGDLHYTDIIVIFVLHCSITGNDMQQNSWA